MSALGGLPVRREDRCQGECCCKTPEQATLQMSVGGADARCIVTGALCSYQREPFPAEADSCLPDQQYQSSGVDGGMLKQRHVVGSLHPAAEG